MSEIDGSVHPLDEKQALVYSHRYLYLLMVGLDAEMKRIKTRLESIIEEGEVVDYGHVYAQWEMAHGPINQAKLKSVYPEVDLEKVKNVSKKLVIRSRMANPSIENLITPIVKPK